MPGVAEGHNHPLVVVAPPPGYSERGLAWGRGNAADKHIAEPLGINHSVIPYPNTQTNAGPYVYTDTGQLD